MRRPVWVAMLALVFVVPTDAAAQSGSAIAGVVRDTTGAVLPGVTVEASSPVLIEKVRTVSTDAQGQYKIVDLRPGQYTVTFTLTGFNSVRRDGIDLTASFTANVNAEMRVGSLEETVTVSGQASTVDVQNVVQQRVMTRDVIDAIPVGSKAVASLAALIPGVTTNNQDVGGTIFGSAALSIHGSRAQEMQLLYDGLMYNNGQGRGGSYTAIAPNDGTVQEVSIEAGGLSAESEMSGLRTNIIPREGGNTFNGSFVTAYTNDSLQGDNLSDELIASGLTSVDKVSVIYDVNPSVGGPIRRDQLWFFGSVRVWKTDQTVAGAYYNLNPKSHVYMPDLSQPAHNDQRDLNQSLRLTWQASSKHKINIQHQNARVDRPGYGYSPVFGRRTYSAEAIEAQRSIPSYLSQIGWNAPLTSRVLIEAGMAFANKDYVSMPQSYADPTALPYRELSTNVAWGYLPVVFGHNSSKNFNTRFNVSYVTGSHAAKVGFTFMHTNSHATQDVANNGMTLQLRNGLPSQVTVYATPLDLDEVTKANVGLFAQDQWTVRRLTLNMGLRFDYLNSYVPASHVGPGPWVPTRNVDFAPVYDVPNWKDVSPRLGVAYDLFGNGKTAVKATVGRYLEGPNLTSFTRLANPAAAISTSATRTWTDLNGDFNAQLNELGPLNNVNFGNSVITRRYDDEVPFDRGFNWETSASVQHELVPRVSLNAGYFHRWYGNFIVTDNLPTTPADYSPYCITAPVDARLPDGGGYQVCGLYDVSVAKFGQTNGLVTFARNFGEQTDQFDGVDVSLNARLPHGIVVSGGTSTGRTKTSRCFVVDSPQELLNCDVAPPFQTQVKLLGVLPLPYGLRLASTFQSIPGPELLANYTASNAQIAPSLGRNLSSCGTAPTCNGTAVVPLVSPGTMYGDRLNQLDFRLAKAIGLGSSRRVEVSVDVYNSLNSNAPLLWNNTFGPAWRPTSVLLARLVKFGARLDF